MEKTHGVTHWDPENCFGCKCQTVFYQPSCFPTTPGGAKVAQTNASEKVLSKDLDAFKRQTQAGHMPKQIDGSARVESEAGSHYEVITGQMAHKMAKGRDRDHGGEEWRRRANEAHEAVQRGETVDVSS